MTLATKKKPPAHIHRKRTGTHRNHGRNYLKPYWPYLPLLAIVGLGLVANSLWSSKPGVLGYATDMSTQRILVDTNAQRAADHESPLKINSKLTAAAQAKANDMATRDYWSHNTPDGRTPWSFITKAGYSYQKAGENLAYGFSSADSTVTGWMNSPEHRANILNASYSDVGFGVVNVPDYNHSGPETLVVAMYAQPISSVKTAVASQTPTTPVQTTPVSAKTVAEPPAQHVARIQLITSGSAPWSLFAISVLASLAVLIFILRHGLIWRRALATSEAFVIHHPFLDIAIVSLATVGFVLSQTSGAIR